MNYLWNVLQTTSNKNHERIAHESLAKAESNKLYFDSFTNYYSDCFDAKWLDRKKKEMDMRITKARIAYSTIYKERKSDYEHTMIRIALIALGVSIATTIASLVLNLANLA